MLQDFLGTYAFSHLMSKQDVLDYTVKTSVFIIYHIQCLLNGMNKVITMWALLTTMVTMWCIEAHNPEKSSVFNDDDNHRCQCLGVIGFDFLGLITLLAISPENMVDSQQLLDVDDGTK